MTSAAAPASSRASNGFTLLEVLVALAILAVAVVASIQGFAQGLRLLKTAGDHQEATLLADQVTRAVVEPIEGREAQAEGRFQWERTVRQIEAPELTPLAAAPAWRVFEIAVTVRWDQDRRVEVTTLRTVPARSDPTRTGRPATTRTTR